MINHRKPTGRVINLADLGDSLFDDHPNFQDPEPEFTKKIEADLLEQKNEGTLSNPKLWKDIESKWETALVAAENSDELLHQQCLQRNQFAAKIFCMTVLLM